MKKTTNQTTSSLPEGSTYEIILQEKIDPQWSEWLSSFDITISQKYTILRGKIRDQSELHGLLMKIRDMNLTIISVTKV